eukprot:m.75723 g.75723  ORF g.75723 m.75723 type:complete len:88 (-) comp24818_c1_seq1:79-342(-)
MYLEKWDDFLKQAQALFVAEPNRTRCSTKYRETDQKVVFKVTDDRVCLQFATDQKQELNKFVTFNTMMVEFMLQSAAALPTVKKTEV